MHLLPRPGVEEAKTIKRAFEWQGKLRDMQRSISKVGDEVKTTKVNKVSSAKHDFSFDPEYTVREVEEKINKEYQLSSSSRKLPPATFSKLNRALEIITKRLEEPLPSEINPEKSIRNDWAHFEKVEAERRAFVEATYRRYRAGESPRLSEDIDQAQFDSIRPTLRKNPEPSTPHHPIKTGTVQVGMGVNTDTSPPQAIQSTQLDRDSFVSNLVTKKSKHRDCSTLNSGQRVEVCYYGIHFPGIIIQRNIGNASVKVEFDDGTINDFPLQSIII